MLVGRSVGYYSKLEHPHNGSNGSRRLLPRRAKKPVDYSGQYSKSVYEQYNATEYLHQSSRHHQPEDLDSISDEEEVEEPTMSRSDSCSGGEDSTVRSDPAAGTHSAVATHSTHMGMDPTVSALLETVNNMLDERTMMILSFRNHFCSSAWHTRNITLLYLSVYASTH